VWCDFDVILYNSIDGNPASSDAGYISRCAANYIRTFRPKHGGTPICLRLQHIEAGRPITIRRIEQQIRIVSLAVDDHATRLDRIKARLNLPDALDHKRKRLFPALAGDRWGCSC
jgi:hypothetical protein